ncbi:hypothetical protein FACS189490_12370 [Clostridia bacterium]|nr:hypothetical protein FACS189490_12370 [Clostridia bacterium]
MEFETLNQGILLRGAITYGKLFHEKNMWGPIMVEASRIEKENAKYARVIMSSDVKDKITSIKQCAPLNKYFTEVEDNFYCFSSIEYETDRLLECQEEHQRVCCIFFNYILRLSGLLNKAQCSKIKEKIKWKADEVKRIMTARDKILNDILGVNPIESAAFGVNKVFNNVYEILAYLPNG